MTLSTHVLDTAQGTPAQGVKIEFWHIDSDNTHRLIREVKTNRDGRVDSPLLNEEESKAGEYELVFFIADYYRSIGDDLPEPPFLDKVPLRFGISDPNSHYHVPLLITPWGYSTYRGS